MKKDLDVRNCIILLACMYHDFLSFALNTFDCKIPFLGYLL